MLRLLSLLDAPDVPAWIGAAMLDVTPPRAEALLESLVDASLLELVPGMPAELPEMTDPPVAEPRYGMHDLVRLFARERAVEEEPAQVRRDALERAFGAWLAEAEAADGRLPTRTLAPIRGGPADLPAGR